MKKTVILLFCLLFLVACESVDENETKKIIYKTPIIVYNGAMSGEMKFSLPVKSMKVLETNGLELKLTDVKMDEGTLEKSKIKNLKEYLRYKNPNKYKVIEAKLKSDIVEPFGSVFIQKYYATLEIEVYTSELKDKNIDELINNSVMVKYYDKLFGEWKISEGTNVNYDDLEGIFITVAKKIKFEDEKRYEKFKTNTSKEFLELISKLDIRLENKETTEEKTKELYAYLSSYIEHSEDVGMKQSVDEVLKSKKGVCYDKAVLFDLAAKRYGLATDINLGICSGKDEKEVPLHAWNIVFGEENMFLVDTDTNVFDIVPYESPFVGDNSVSYKMYCPKTKKYEDYTYKKNENRLTLNYVLTLEDEIDLQRTGVVQ